MPKTPSTVGKIKLLAPHEIHKIAAGEVIERPANVIKELVENGLDAQATSITVYVEEAGKSLLRVIDNGSGMSAADARMSIKHHATSKINALADLEQLETFGFRGEALSSIASVARVTLITKERESLEGTRIVVEDSVIRAEEPWSCSLGTDISIADLFYNVPARRKFLKSDETEMRVISHLMHAFALSYPSVTFRLYHNQKLLMHAERTTSLSNRISMLYDKACIDAMLSCSFTETKPNKPKLGIEAVVTNPHYMRYDRNHLYIFVNKRWVKNSKLAHVVLKGYNGVLPPGRYPTAVIFITVDPSSVDINTHPRKEEVHFLHARHVESAVEILVRTTLEEYMRKALGTAIAGSANQPSIHITHAGLESTGSINTIPVATASISTAPVNTVPMSTNHLPTSTHTQTVFQQELQRSYAQAVMTVPPQVTEREKKDFAQAVEHSLAATDAEFLQPTQTAIPASPTEKALNYRLIGHAHKTYIILENEKGIVMIDQHAAHERVLYELFEHRFDQVAILTLLFPPVFTLADYEGTLIQKYQDLFARYGISIEACGERQYAIRTVPIPLKEQNITDLIKSMLATLGTTSHADQELFERAVHHNIRAQMACKAAVKAGDELTQEQMHELIESLSSIDNNFTCPHGRPTSWVITQYELEKKFKRKI